MAGILTYFSAVWLVDFEFQQPEGERPAPLCLVARDWRTGRTLRLWRDELLANAAAPYPVGPDSLFVAYYASAELGCHLALGWPMPARVLDLFTEFRNLTNGRPVPNGNGLLGALEYFGLDGIAAAEKEGMRALALRGGPYSEVEAKALLAYCETDVEALGRLLPAILPHIDLPRALLRGRYMAAAARMERTGVPIEVQALGRLRRNWERIKGRLVREVDANYCVYSQEGRGFSFSRNRFAQWLAAQGIPWPRLPSGQLALDDDTFRQMAKSHPAVAPLRELRHTLGEMRLESLAVGSDGRNRCLLSAFRSRTSRNQPSNSRFIFGPSTWLRGLIRPEPGRAVAYVDWAQQEFGIAAALSGDAAMQDAYSSGDPYLTFAKQAGAVPADATKATHKAERERFKVCALAVQYGMGEQSLAAALGQTPADARDLLRLHQRLYATYWRWSQAAVDHAMLHGWLQTVFGWRIHVGADANPRSLANFPMQANGAEMLRLACCILTERGIAVCAPVHDALLVEGPVDTIEATVAATQGAMAEASRVVLGGFELGTDAKIVHHPDRYMDPRGAAFWAAVWKIVAQVEAEEAAWTPAGAGESGRHGDGELAREDAGDQGRDVRGLGPDAAGGPEHGVVGDPAAADVGRFCLAHEPAGTSGHGTVGHV